MDKQTQHNLFLGASIGLLAYFLFKKPKPKPNVIGTKVMDRFKESNAKIIEGLHPKEKQTFINFLNDIKSLGYAYVLTDGFRTFKESERLKQINSKNASPGYSAHNYGLGLDLNLIKDNKWINKNSPLNEWINTGVVKLAKDKYKMRWGGEFPGYKDSVHFDLMNKYNINSLLANAKKQFGSIDKIVGNRVNLV